MIQQRADMIEYIGLFLEQGRPKFDVLLKIPSVERLVDLPSAIGAKNTLKFINVAVGDCVRSCGIDNIPLSVDISAQIMGEAYEDNLSLQDVFIFARSFMSGKYGKVYGQLTLLAFMEKFEEYRQERHEFIMSYREEQQANHKAAGIRERSSDGQVDAQDEVMRAVYNYHANKAKNNEG